MEYTRYTGLDVHKQFVQAATMSPDGDVLREWPLVGPERAACDSPGQGREAGAALGQAHTRPSPGGAAQGRGVPSLQDSAGGVGRLPTARAVGCNVPSLRDSSKQSSPPRGRCSTSSGTC